MIPPILHQTWKTERIPERFQAWTETWSRHNPGWKRMFWSDRALLEFVAAHYPDYLPTFCAYQNGVQRADAGRYLLLHHFGGVYADIDCECLAPFDPIMGEDRVVICKEPAFHATLSARVRGLPYLLFNGTLASPPGHPFWLHLMAHLPGLVSAKDVLDATGPCVLTSAQLSFPDQGALAIHPSHLFASMDRDGRTEQPLGNERAEKLSVHHWAGTWVRPRLGRGWLRSVKREVYRAKYLLTRGEQADPAALQAAVDPAVLGRAAPAEGNVAILVPLRDAAEHIAPFLQAIGSLDYPSERLKLVFCEGDSTDDSWDVLQREIKPLRGRFRDVVLLRKHLGGELDRSSRHKPSSQRTRRAGLAKVRNHLVRQGLDENDDWALWMDIDVWKFPADIIRILTGAGGRIVTPNCVKVAGGPSFDLNAFLSVEPEFNHRYYRSVINGLYQPHERVWSRLHLSDVRHLERIELHGVGGCMLLVDAALHRGGLLFPEKPYKDLVETEAFGVLARDLGVAPVGLPKVEVMHVPW